MTLWAHSSSWIYLNSSQLNAWLGGVRHTRYNLHQRTLMVGKAQHYGMQFGFLQVVYILFSSCLMDPFGKSQTLSDSC
jgi:hypothetical protein